MSRNVLCHSGTSERNANAIPFPSFVAQLRVAGSKELIPPWLPMERLHLGAFALILAVLLQEEDWKL